MQTNENELPRRKSAAHLKVPARKAITPPPAAVPQAPPSRKSIAGLTVRPSKAPVRIVPECRPPNPGRETTAAYERLRALLNSLPANKNDRAIVLIKACIMEGICIDRKIVSVLVHLGFDNFHAGAMLHRHTRGKGSTAHWSKGADGRFRLLD